MAYRSQWWRMRKSVRANKTTCEDWGRDTGHVDMLLLGQKNRHDRRKSDEGGGKRQGEPKAKRVRAQIEKYRRKRKIVPA